MLDRHSSDCFNPVFLRHLRGQLDSRLPVLAGGLLIIFQTLLLLNRLDEDFTKGMTIVMLLLGLAATTVSALGVVNQTMRARNVDGMDPGLGTQLTAGRILLGQVLALLSSAAIPLVCILPTVWLAHSIGCLDPARLLTALTLLLAILFVLLAAVQSGPGSSGQHFSPLWLVVAAAILPALIIILALVVSMPGRETSPIAMLPLNCIAVSVIALSCAAIHGANRPRTLDGTASMHQASLLLWLLWLPLLYIFADIYPQWPGRNNGKAMDPLALWAVITSGYSLALFFLASIEPIRPTRRLGVTLSGGGSRWLLLPLQGGAVPGYILAFAVGAVGLLLFAALRHRMQFIGEHSLQAAVIAVSYALFYSALVLWLRRRLNRSAGTVYVLLWLVLAVAQLFGVIWNLTGPNHDGPTVTSLLTSEYFIRSLDQGFNPLCLIPGAGGLLLWWFATARRYFTELEATRPRQLP